MTAISMQGWSAILNGPMNTGMTILPKILKELYALTKKLGGTLSGEHGIGCKRKKYINCVVSEEYIDMMRVIKNAFDPNYVMNPGKIFD